MYYVYIGYSLKSNPLYYEKCENDLFASLGEMVCQYKGIGKVLVLGDFNSRTGSNDDYISNDIINEESADMISNVVNYVPDSEPCKRTNSDPVTNQFGRQLISLCKTTALRIVNGRHKDDPNGNITFYNSRGSSLIDYVLTFDDNFNNILQFQSGVFNVFSDHSPVCITLSTRVPKENEQTNTGREHQYTNVKWNDEHTESVLRLLEIHSTELLNACTNIEHSQNGIDQSVKNLTKIMNEMCLSVCHICFT